MEIVEIDLSTDTNYDVAQKGFWVFVVEVWIWGRTESRVQRKMAMIGFVLHFEAHCKLTFALHVQKI